MLKVALSVNGIGKRSIDIENLKRMKSAGIDAVEISLGRDLSIALDYDELKRAAEEADIELWSFHLPFMPFEEIDISSTDEALRKFSVDMCADMIKKGRGIGITKFVIHPSGEPIDDSERKAKTEAAKRSLAELGRLANGLGAVLCVENLPRTCLGRSSDEILELISDNDSLRVCFDTNHLLEEDISRFIAAVGNKIATLHISDYDRLNERHWLSGEGCIDWQKLYRELMAVGYSGAWLYEIHLDTPPTLKRERELGFSDLKANAEEIFCGKAPTRLGTPVPDLTAWK